MSATTFDGRTVLVSEAEAQAVIEAIDQRDGRSMSPARAVVAAKGLMGLFPAKAFSEPEVFVTALAILLSAYDPEFVARVCDPVDGIATRLKYALSLADVKEALEAEKNRRLSILSMARWTLKELDRRAREREMSRSLSAEEEERRVRLVDALLKPKTIEDAGKLQSGHAAAPESSEGENK
jgi:hypothetical protein